MRGAKNSYTHLQHWSLAGITYHKADIQTRSRFALSAEECEHLYALGRAAGIQNFLAISTCNRTEFYGSIPPLALKAFVLEYYHSRSVTGGVSFESKEGIDAARHFFRMVCGLDSQIIGDYEIVAQVKQALKLARRHQVAATLLDRVSNFAAQASKQIRSETNMSAGKYSVSFAAVEWLAAQHALRGVNNILLIGTGSFGALVARRMKERFPLANITLANRTAARATALADGLGLSTMAYEKISGQLATFDTIITCIGPQTPLILASDLTEAAGMRIIDLGIPQATEAAVASLPGVIRCTIDDIAAFYNTRMQQRMRDLPKAEALLDQWVERLTEWHQLYTSARVISAYRSKLQHLINPEETRDNLDRSFRPLYERVRDNGYSGCDVLHGLTSIIEKHT